MSKCLLGHHDLPASAFEIDNMMKGATGKAKRSQKPLPDSAFEIQNMMRGSGNITELNNFFFKD